MRTVKVIAANMSLAIADRIRGCMAVYVPQGHAIGCSVCSSHIYEDPTQAVCRSPAGHLLVGLTMNCRKCCQINVQVAKPTANRGTGSRPATARAGALRRPVRRLLARSGEGTSAWALEAGRGRRGRVRRLLIPATCPPPTRKNPPASPAYILSATHRVSGTRAPASFLGGAGLRAHVLVAGHRWPARSPMLPTSQALDC